MSDPMSDLDVIVIGAGHNGLTCAAYLGMAGLRVRVLERRGVVGGACVTRNSIPASATRRRPTPSACCSRR